MTDEYYRQQAARRARRLWLFLGVTLFIVCIGLGVTSLYYDACTGGFERSAEAVLQRYVSMVNQGQVTAAQACWGEEAYYELSTGCSQVCLDGVLGNDFELVDLEFAEPQTEPGGRTTLEAEVAAVCQASRERHTGQVVLDTVGRDYPWRHWRIVYSTIGGSVQEPWCR